MSFSIHLHDHPVLQLHAMFGTEREKTPSDKRTERKSEKKKRNETMRSTHVQFIQFHLPNKRRNSSYASHRSVDANERDGKPDNDDDENTKCVNSKNTVLCALFFVVVWVCKLLHVAWVKRRCYYVLKFVCRSPQVTSSSVSVCFSRCSLRIGNSRRQNNFHVFVQKPKKKTAAKDNPIDSQTNYDYIDQTEFYLRLVHSSFFLV